LVAGNTVAPWHESACWDGSVQYYSKHMLGDVISTPSRAGVVITGYYICAMYEYAVFDIKLAYNH